MLLEIIGFLLFVILGLVAYSEHQPRKPVAGMAASFLLLVSSVWMMDTGVQIKNGESITIVETHLANITESENGTTETSYSYNADNLTDSTTATPLLSIDGNSSTSVVGTRTTTYVYSSISTPFVEIGYLVGFIFLLLSLYGLFIYSIEMIG
jgi:hypothetical protein